MGAQSHVWGKQDKAVAVMRHTRHEFRHNFSSRFSEQQVRRQQRGVQHFAALFGVSSVTVSLKRDRRLMMRIGSMDMIGSACAARTTICPASPIMW